MTPCSPFVTGVPVEDQTLFVGRQEQLHQLTRAMTNSKPTSINVVGAPRIGKSSLLYHFAQTWDQRVPNPKNYVVIYLPLRKFHCEQEDHFYQAVADELLQQGGVQRNGALQGSLRVQLQRHSFAAAMAQWRERGMLAVVCIDDFEVLLHHPEGFGDEFFDSLRSLRDRHALMWVIASRRPLAEYKRQARLTSSFFQFPQVIWVRELGSETEIYGILNQPGEQGQVLDSEAQAVAAQLGKRHPYRLQLAGQCLWEARFVNGQDLDWAREQFWQRLQGQGWLPKWPGQLWGPLRWILWEVPVRLGKLAQLVGQRWDELGHWFAGVTLLLVVAVASIGATHFEQLRSWAQDWVKGL